MERIRIRIEFWREKSKAMEISHRGIVYGANCRQCENINLDFSEKKYPQWKTIDEFWAWVDEKVKHRLTQASGVRAPKFKIGAPAGI